MTTCSKTVQEVEFKFFQKYVDALLDSNYVVESVDVEGGSPPDFVRSKTLQEDFLIKNFTRSNGKDKFIEKVYIKVN